MKYVFIADFFKENIQGGGEIVNEEIINSLRAKDHTVIKKHSHQVDLFFLDQQTGYNFIVGNFLNLSESSKRRLGREKYIIYEHDHKYLKTRDPSPFENFKAPVDEIINLDFYRNALAIVCQSKLHAAVMKTNLDLNNIINAGGNPWPAEDLENLRTHAKSHKEPICGIMDSPNKIKNTIGALNYCKEKDLKYKLIEFCSHEEFIKQLASCEKFVFFPQVLETLSRVVIEARILGCKIVTNNLVGATSEEWFSLKGIELLDHLKNKKEEIVRIFIDTFMRKGVYEDITVILNAYRRPDNLKMQIEAIRGQSRPPKQLWVWVNDHPDLEGYDFANCGADRVFRNDHNWKFYGRFAAALLAETEYVAIFDDDTIPGREWFANCLETMEVNEGILGSAGVILKSDTYDPHERCGWPSQNSETVEVDLVGHAWFFKRDWVKYLWAEYPTTWDNGEDMRFSYLAQKYGGINTYCPPHPPDNRDRHGSLYGYQLGIDSKATSNNKEVSHNLFFSERDYCVQTALLDGWKTVRKMKA